MSLAMSVIQNDFFIVTSDSAMVGIPYDEKLLEETGEYVTTGEMVSSDFRSEKTHKLSNKVFLLATGTHVLTTALEQELFGLVKGNSDLNECKRIAKKVVTNLRNGKINDTDKVVLELATSLELTDTTEEIEKEIQETLLLIDKIQFSAYLVGFNKDGTSGLYNILTDDYIETPKGENRGYPIIISGHIPGGDDAPKRYTEFQYDLLLPTGERTILNFIAAMTRIHAQISSESRINVSTDCKFDIVRWEDGKAAHDSFTTDTLDFYEQLGLKS